MNLGEKVSEAIDTIQTKQGVEFNYPDVSIFREAVLPLHEETLARQPELRNIYKIIEEKNKK